MTDANHDNLNKTTEDKLNVHGFLVALARIFNRHLKLGQDHSEHLLETWVAFRAAGLAERGECGVAGLHETVV